MFKVLILSLVLFQAKESANKFQTTNISFTEHSGYVLTEVDKLTAENLKLKSQIIQLNQKLIEAQLAPATNQLSSEITKFIEDMRIKMKAGKDDVFNWDTLKFEVKKDETKK